LKATHQQTPLKVQGEQPQPQPPRRLSSSQARAQSKTGKNDQKEGTHSAAGGPDAKLKRAMSSVGKVEPRLKRAASQPATQQKDAASTAASSESSDSSSSDDEGWWVPYAILDERTVKGVREYRGQSTRTLKKRCAAW
jgi:hypothetical protein